MFESFNGFTSSPPPTQSANFGFNMALPSYSEWSNPLNNLALYLSPYDNATSGTAVINPANGDHVSGNAQYTIWCRDGVTLNAGPFVTQWTGTGSVSGDPTSPGVITVNPGQQSITFGVSGQVESLSIIKQGAAGIYTGTFSSRASRASCLRMMDVWRTNYPEYDASNPWVRIPTPTGVNEFRHKVLTPTLVANIAKDMGSDLWICVHHLVSDANVTQIATDINATGFSGTVYFEHSNEVWNSSFPQYVYGSTQIGGYGGPGTAQNIQAWHADRTHTLGGIFKAVIPSAVVVWGSQMAVPNFIQTSLQYCVTALTNIDACAIGAYFGGPWSRTLTGSQAQALTNQQIANSAEADFDNRVKPLINTWITEAANTTYHPVWRLLGYEGGSHLDNSDATAQTKLAQASNAAPMGTVYGRYLDWWDLNVNDLLCLYKDVGGPDDPWSPITGELGTPAPRWEAFLART